MLKSLDIRKLYNNLLKFYGNLYWWPAESPFEVVIGAILTQNTNWRNVEKALINMKKEQLVDPKKILHIDSEHLKKIIRPAGFYNQKAERLKSISAFIINNLDNDIKNLQKYSIQMARKKLLLIKGIGFETTDSILLYAADMPIFVIDSYTKRLVNRLNITSETDYHILQNIFMDNLEKNIKLYKEYHALIVEHSKRYCCKKPLCNHCFIRDKCNYYINGREN